MRGGVPGLVAPHPLGDTLPALYLEDTFAQRLCAGLDEVLAPVFATLDCLAAYFDPGTAPPDVLDWLAGWVGFHVDGEWSEERRRQLVRAAADLHAWRGTPRAVRDIVQMTTGEVPEIDEPGGTTWSQDPDTPLPGRRQPELVVRLRVADPAAVDQPRLSAAVAIVAPAHIPWRIEVLPSDGYSPQ